MGTTRTRDVIDIAEQAAAEIRARFEEATSDTLPWLVGKVRIAVPSLAGRSVEELGRGDDYGLLHGYIADAGGHKNAYDFIENTTIGNTHFSLETDGVTFSGFVYAWDQSYRP